MNPGKLLVAACGAWLAFGGFAFVMLLSDCKPPPHVPGFDASDAATWIVMQPDGAVSLVDPVAACANLIKLGCVPAADAPLCARALANAPSFGKTTSRAIQCAANAGTTEAARTCDQSYFCR